MNKKHELDLQAAIFLMNPDTQSSLLEQLKELSDDDRNELLLKAAYLTCQAADRQIIKPAINKSIGVWACPVCGKILYAKQNFCNVCGQALDVDGHSKDVIMAAQSNIILQS